MDKNGEKVHARLKWEVACERLAFTLGPPSGPPLEDAPDLEEAILLAHAALQELRDAFKADSKGEEGA